MSTLESPVTATRLKPPRSLLLTAAVVICIALVLAFVSPLVSAWLVILVLAAILAGTAPLLALALLPVAVALGSLISVQAAGANIGPTDVLTGVLVLAGLVALGARWQTAGAASKTGFSLRAGWRAIVLRVRAYPAATALFAGLVAYLVVVVLSLLVARSRVATAKEIIKWTEVLVVALATLWIVRTRRDLHVVAWSLIGATLAEALLGYAQWVTASGDLGAGGARLRVFGTFAQPNPYAAELNFGLPLALALLLFGRDARERWVAAGAATLLFGAQLLAYSRGALLGFAVAMVVVLIVAWRRELLALAVAVGAVIVGGIAWVAHIIPAHVESRILAQVDLSQRTLCNGVNNANYSTMERLAHWLAGLRMFAGNPLLGVGAGNYNAAYARYSLACWPEPLGHAHNYYINAAAETGILGLLAFLALLGAALYAAWRATHPRGTPAAADSAMSQPATKPRVVVDRALALGFTAVLVVVLVHSLTDDLFVHAMELQFAICLGCLARMSMTRASAHG